MHIYPDYITFITSERVRAAEREKVMVRKASY